jgi:hypothetical protein
MRASDGIDSLWGNNAEAVFEDLPERVIELVAVGASRASWDQRRPTTRRARGCKAWSP